MKGLDDLPVVLTIPETAKVLRIGRNLAYEAARRGELPTVRIGGRLLIPRAGLIDMLKATCSKPKNTASRNSLSQGGKVS